MSSKYANLPDIDSARDVYETQDVDASSTGELGHSDEDEHAMPREAAPSAEELDGSRLPDREEVGRFFKKAERRKPRRTVYTYPPSPTQSRSPSPGDASSSTRGPPLRSRLRALQQELLALEAEISDPSNPLLAADADGSIVDPGEMLKGLVEVRGKLNMLGGGQVGGKRTDLVDRAVKAAKINHDQPSPSKPHPRPSHVGRSASIGDNKTLADLDHRVADLEKLIGSSNASLDESSPLPPALLPQINRMSNQITLLTQPRHIDSISRRLKLLLTDLERHQGSAKRSAASKEAKDPKESVTSPSIVPADLAPILQRLSPLLPTIPHLLQRLRTLSSLHTSASGFASTLSSLEEEQARVRGSLTELTEAIEGVEKSIGENVTRVEGNLKGMEARLDDLVARLALLSSDGSNSVHAL